MTYFYFDFMTFIRSVRSTTPLLTFFSARIPKSVSLLKAAPEYTALDGLSLYEPHISFFESSFIVN